jgi:hypothetical protein
MGRYLEMLRSNTDPEAPARNSPDCEKSEKIQRSDGLPILREVAALPPPACRVRGCPKHFGPSVLAVGSRPVERYSRDWRAPMRLRRCGALVCRACHVHSSSPHRQDCAASRFEPCRSRWFWLSSHGAIKCVACATPPDLGLVEAWVLARETGEDSEDSIISGDRPAQWHSHEKVRADALDLAGQLDFPGRF